MMLERITCAIHLEFEVKRSSGVTHGTFRLVVIAPFLLFIKQGYKLADYSFFSSRVHLFHERRLRMKVMSFLNVCKG